MNPDRRTRPRYRVMAHAMPIHAGSNAIARIIINHSAKMGNGAWLVDSGTMTKEEADQRDGAPTEAGPRFAGLHQFGGDSNS